jgi:hypothetical protein
VLRNLDKKGIKNILVRSPIVGGPWDGSLYARDVGITDKGRLPVIGENPAVTAVQALSEPLSQGALSCLMEGTLVRMANLSVKKIEDINVGDYVLGYTEDGDYWPVRVSNTFNNGVRECFTFEFYNLATQTVVTLQSTADHKLLAVIAQQDNDEPGDSKTDQFPAGYECAVFYAYNANTRLYKRKPEWTALGLQPTFDIEVESASHLFILANGLIVSNSKHTGGVYGSFAAKAVTGFKTVNQLIQVPKVYSGGAAHAQTDGTVQAIEKAAAGGHYVMVDGVKHFAPNDQELKVKQGDVVEAGDILSDGLPNPAEVVRHKGIGEGRRYFVNTMLQACKNAGIGVSKRNVEMLARGLVNHVTINKEYKDWLPDESVPYGLLERSYEPREGAAKIKPEHAKNQYLEHPVLHYTIGTKVRPSVIKTLQNYGVKEIVTHKEPPPFETEMIRGQSILQHDPDWLVRMYGSGQKRGILEAVHRGRSTNPLGTSFVPALIMGVDFNKRIDNKPVSKVTSPLANLPKDTKAPRLDYDLENNPFD